MNRCYRLIWNPALHASEGLFNIVRPLRGSPAAADRSFRCMESRKERMWLKGDISMSMKLGSRAACLVLAAAAIAISFAPAAGATPVTINLVAAGANGSGGPSVSESWNASSPDLGPGVGCDPVLGDCYGADLYITSSGSVGVGESATVATAPVVLQVNNPLAHLTITKGAPPSTGYNHYQPGYTITQTPGTGSFSQASPELSGSLGANLSISNSVSFQFCAVGCVGDSGSFGSYSGSFNILGTSTNNDGTLSFLANSVNGVNGKSIPLIISSPGIVGATDAGSIEINPPTSLSGSGSLANQNYSGVAASSNTTVAQLSVDLGKVAASLTGKSYLAPEGNYSIDGVGISYDVASAVLNLSESLNQQTTVSLEPGAADISFYNANGTPLTIPFYFHDQYGDSPLGQFSEFSDSFALWGGLLAGLSQNLAGDYAILSGTLQLTVSQLISLSLSGDLDLSVLSGSVSGGPLGSAGFGPVYSDDIPFDTSENLLTNSQIFDFPVAQKVYFPGSSVAVPEPPNWAFMLMGVIGIGVAEATRRRRADRKNRRTTV